MGKVRESEDIWWDRVVIRRMESWAKSEGPLGNEGWRGSEGIKRGANDISGKQLKGSQGIRKEVCGKGLKLKDTYLPEL